MENLSLAPQIILASSSIYRQKLLEQLGLSFLAIPPEVDEAVLQQNEFLEPLQIAQRLAKMKAEAVAVNHPQSIVIGSDQVVDFAGEILGKPGNLEKNTEMLQQLSGSTHQLITAVSVYAQQVYYAFVNQTAITVRELTNAEITRYVDRDQPFHCAGGYRWEAAGVSLFEKVETEDHTAILGLPLIRLVTVLRSLGVQIP